MKAILWDGNNQIHGSIKLNKEVLCFILSDFGETNLKFEIPIRQIDTISYFKPFDIIVRGVVIITIDGHHNVLIVLNPIRLKRIIETSRQQM